METEETPKDKNLDLRDKLELEVRFFTQRQEQLKKYKTGHYDLESAKWVRYGKIDILNEVLFALKTILDSTK